MSKTLVLIFHPSLTQSRANAALARGAAAVPATEIVDMYTKYPTGIDMDRDSEWEAAKLLSADHIVLQFPIQWYSTPPLLKAWQDSVLTRMFYLVYEKEGRRLEGTQLMIAATAGNSSDAYRCGGRNRFSIDELFAPLRATAHRCGLHWAKPFLLYKADKLSLAELDVAVEEYQTSIRDWIRTTSREKAA